MAKTRTFLKADNASSGSVDPPDFFLKKVPKKA